MAERYTIEDTRPPDRVDGYPTGVPKWYRKFFESLPAFITWTTLLLPVIFALVGWPEGFVAYMSFLIIYWAVRGLFFMLGASIAYSRMARDTKVDWVKKIKGEKLDDSKLKYVLIYPLVHEGKDTIEPALKAWTESTIDSKKISLVLALEEKFAERTQETLKPILEEYGDKFGEVVTSIHPNDIPGEIKGVKGANINWASRKFVRLVEKRGEDLKDYLLITSDSDLRPHKRFLAAVTYKHLSSDDPYRETYSAAVHTFSNNIWRVPALVRVFSNLITIAIMHKWGLSGMNANPTFSAFVVNLQTVKDVHFWDPQLENDDTAFYWNSVVRFGGHFRSNVVYIPTYNDAVENENMWKTYRSLWKQQVRWGWGTINFPMTWVSIYKDRRFTASKIAKIFFKLFDDQLFFRTTVVLITFGIPVLTLLSPEFSYSASAYALPKLMSTIMNITLIFNIPILYIKRKLVPPPKEWGILRNIQDIVETALLVVIQLTFGFMPATQAQTEMLFRKGATEKDHYATEKVAMKK